MDEDKIIINKKFSLASLPAVEDFCRYCGGGDCVVAKENLIPPIPEVPLYTLSGINVRPNHILHDIFPFLARLPPNRANKRLFNWSENKHKKLAINPKLGFRKRLQERKNRATPKPDTLIFVDPYTRIPRR
jgi:hypothetical protein